MSVHLYSNVFRGHFVGHKRAANVLSDFPARFCILEPFCWIEDRCRTGRARIPRMPYLSLFVLTLSLLLPHIRDLLLYLQCVAWLVGQSSSLFLSRTSIALVSVRDLGARRSLFSALLLLLFFSLLFHPPTRFYANFAESPFSLVHPQGFRLHRTYMFPRQTHVFSCVVLLWRTRSNSFCHARTPTHLVLLRHANFVNLFCLCKNVWGFGTPVGVNVVLLREFAKLRNVILLSS